MNMTTVRKFAVFAFAGLALAACSGESGDMGAGALPTVTQDALPEPTPPTAPPPPNIDISITMLDTKADTVRFLSRATFGGTKADIDALTGTDAVTWLQDGLIATLESTGMIFHRFWYTGRCDIAIADRFDFEHIVSISYSVKGCVDSFEQSKDLLWLSGR